MTLADLSPGEIFVGVAHTIREKTGSSEIEAFPVADQVAQRLSPSRSFNDKLFPSLLRRYELVNSVKASIQLDDQTDQTIYDAAMQALKKIDALEKLKTPEAAASTATSASASAAPSDPPRRIKPGPLQNFIRSCVYLYRQDRLSLAMMSIPALAILAVLLLSLRLVTSGLL